MWRSWGKNGDFWNWKLRSSRLLALSLPFLYFFSLILCLSPPRPAIPDTAPDVGWWRSGGGGGSPRCLTRFTAAIAARQFVLHLYDPCDVTAGAPFNLTPQLSGAGTIYSWASFLSEVHSTSSAQPCLPSARILKTTWTARRGSEMVYTERMK